MDAKFNEILYDKVSKMMIRLNDNNVSALQLGFAISDCVYVKTILTSICWHALQNLVLVEEDRKDNLVEIINKIGYGRKS